MTHRSKSTLFLIEQLIVIAVFAICAVACISILTSAYFTAGDSAATSQAILAAESGAEVFKATGGDFEELVNILGGIGEIAGSGNTVITIYYNDAWQACTQGNASYVLSFAIDAPRVSRGISLYSGELTVEKITGEELVSFPVAARN